MTVDDEARAIIEAIHAAFRGVSRGEITIHEAEVIDEYGTKEERVVARRLDTERSWEEIPDQHVEECTTALCHVDPKSWRYYVPRYMEWSLCHFRTNDSNVSDFTIYTFDPSSTDSTLYEYSMERYRQLTPEQAQVVGRFLRYMARNPDHADDVVANEALRKYWGVFQP
jgi:hypothetical protein